MSSMLCTLLALTTPKINWQVQIGCLLRIEPNGVTSRKIHGVSPKTLPFRRSWSRSAYGVILTFTVGKTAIQFPVFFSFTVMENARRKLRPQVPIERRFVSKVLRKNKALFRSVFCQLYRFSFLFLFFFFFFSLLDLHCLGCRWCAL